MTAASPAASGSILLRELLTTAVENVALRRRLIVLLAAYVVVTAGLAALMFQMRFDAIDAGERVLSAFAQLTEEQTTRTIQNVDQTLEIVSDRLSVARRDGVASEPAIQAELRALLVSRPFLTAIAVLDRQGRTVYGSTLGQGTLDLSDRDYFIGQRDDPKSGFMLGVPVQSRATGHWTLPASRPLPRDDGEFAGIVGAVIDPLFFNRVWTVDRAIPEQATALWRNDGVILMRSPFDERTMGVASKGLLAARMAAGSAEGTMRTVSLIDGAERLVAYRRLAAYPNLTLSVTEPMDRVLAPWRRTAWIVAVAWAGASAALAWLALRLVRETGTRRASQDRYRVLFKANPYPMVVMDRETRGFLAINDAAVEEYGWSREEGLAMKANDIYPPEDLPVVAAMRLADVTGDAKVVRGLRHRRKDGTLFDVEMHTRSLELDGRAAILTISENVTERRAVEEQLRHSQKMEIVGQLTGGISHDFNNLLMVIMANLEALQEAKNLDAATVDHLDVIDQAVSRASDLTGQLLAFSRKQPLRPEPTDLNDLVSGTGKLLRHALGEHIEIDSLLAEDLWDINIDRAQLKTVLINLCINARDAMPGGGKLLIETGNVSLDNDDIAQAIDVAAGDYAMITVTDTGSGMPPETAAKVFEPFFTTKEVGKGTGLGLSMVYGFIKQSQGHITIHSEVGRGTTFQLYLPRSGGPRDKPPVRQSAPMAHGAERILVVEDQPQVRESVVQQLQSLGYDVSQAADGEAGIASFEAALRPYDLLLTDVVMPGLLNGKALAAEVERRWPRTRVVFMSGYDRTAIVHHSRRDGGRLLLNKPFRKRDLSEIVRRALDGEIAGGRPWGRPDGMAAS